MSSVDMWDSHHNDRKLGQFIFSGSNNSNRNVSFFVIRREMIECWQ